MSGLDILNNSSRVRYNNYRNTTHLAVGKEAALKQSSKNIYANDTAALLLRISRDDGEDGESNSIQNQELICKGWFLPSNTYDCGSFVVN